MANIIIRKSLDISEKISLMNVDARYDVAENNNGSVDLNAVCGIKSPAAIPKVPKVFLSNDCVFNCAYCGCRATNGERGRYCNAPRDLAEIAVRQAHERGCGVFITSAICKNPDYTQELIIETLKVIRNDLNYGGYVHAKVMPGADPVLIQKTGQYSNRLSVNIEVAKSEGYQLIARQKNKSNILTPMKKISELIAEAGAPARGRGKFATSQTTQLMAGSTGEDDRTILVLSKAMYSKYRLKRVYYTPFHYQHPAAGYDLPPVATPVRRIYRLYQADRLMQLYGFEPDELVPEAHSDLEPDLDPKLSWALRNIQLFPVELNKADYETLMRVPGIGDIYARRILAARRYCGVTFETLKKIGVPVKKSMYFITCYGKYAGGRDINADIIRGLHAEQMALEM